ncbi:hypothetical protein ABK040_016093, partial [Willaertia magna]
MLKPKDNKLMMTTTTMEDNNKLEILKSKLENVTTIEEEEITSSSFSDSSTNSKSEEKKKKNTNSFLILFNKLIKPLLFSCAWIPLTIFFLIMSNFEFIAYQCVYNSQEKYESQIGIETLAKLDKIFTLGFFVPYELMTYVYHPLLDFFFAIPYLNHFVFPLFIYPVIICLIIPNFSSIKQLLTRLHPRKKVKLTTRKLKVYLLSLGTISIFQMILCIISPTAPPWYRTNLIRQHMVNTIFSSSSNLAPSPLTYNVEARFENVDRIIGFSLFHNIYSNGKIKYGSFYSLHVGWSSVILFVEMFVLAGGWTFKKTKKSIMKRTSSVMDDVVPVAVTGSNDEESCYYERNGLKEEEVKDLENQSNQ